MKERSILHYSIKEGVHTLIPETKKVSSSPLQYKVNRCNSALENQERGVHTCITISKIIPLPT